MENKKKVACIKTVITDNINNTKRSFLENYWNSQQNFIIERIDESKNGTDSEIIIETQIQEKPKKTEIIRLIRKENILTPVLHSIVTDNEDGSQTEIEVV